MPSRLRTVSRPLFLGILLAVGVVLATGCDSVPGREGEQRRPTVSNLQMLTDSVEVLEEDSLAQMDLTLAVRASDADGSIERVVFTIEPASNPRGTVNGELAVVDGVLYGGRVRFTVPLVEELYTVRVFAVDDDELSSNQVTGQFEFNPDAHTNGSAALKGAASPQSLFPNPRSAE